MASSNADKPNVKMKLGRGYRAVRMFLWFLGIVLTAVFGIYLWVTGGRQEAWTPFLQGLLPIASLLVTFSGVMYINATTSLRDLAREIWDNESIRFKPILDRDYDKRPQFADLNEDTVKQMQADLVKVQGVLAPGVSLARKMAAQLRNIFVLWGVTSSSTLYLILVPSAQPVRPTDSAIFAFALLAMYFEAVQFALFTWRAVRVYTLRYSDGLIAALDGGIKQDLQRRNVRRDMDEIDEALEKMKENNEITDGIIRRMKEQEES